MSGKLSSLSRRLAKIEQQMADQAQRAELANCNCKHMPDVTIANTVLPEEFEAEMNLRPWLPSSGQDHANCLCQPGRFRGAQSQVGRTDRDLQSSSCSR